MMCESATVVSTGLADDVGEVVAIEPLAQGATPRVYKDECAELLGPCPEALVVLVAELPARRGGRDLHAFEPEIGDGVDQSLLGHVGVLDRGEPETDEPVRAGRTQLCDALVDGAEDPARERLVGPGVVVRRRGVDELDVHPLAVHLLHASFEVRQERPDLHEHRLLVLHGLGAEVDEVGFAFLLESRLPGDEFERRRDHGMGVDVHRRRGTIHAPSFAR
jgi:hypothetical protein